ncbi:MAG TPA: TetR/AcrR family transcriptional regulator [Mycobacteriales bacterium]|nr:TetR/AcrR family transcriptional regulator [Mycobacteriales bacterium]
MAEPQEKSAWPQPPRRRGRARQTQRRPARTLSRAAIVDAAIRVLDAEGLDALTMRRVAEELGTGPASLYAHVADKDEMVNTVLDRIFSEVTIPDPIDPKRWQEQLKELARSGRATFNRHRDVARASLGNIPTGEGALPGMNAMVGILLAGGVSPTVASLSVDILALYLTATAYEESLEAFPTDEEGSEQFHTELKSFFASLPADRFPHLVAMAEPLTSGDGDHRFEFGLDLLVRGIASTVNPAEARPKRSAH